MNIGIKDVIQRIRLFFILYLLLFAACLTIKLLYSRSEIFFAVNSIHSAWADFVMPFYTNLGDGWTIIIISAIWALFNYRGAFLMATSYGVTSIIAQVMKHIVGAPRPKLYFHDQLSHIHFVKGVDVLSSQSFPSGHTVTAFSAAVVATYLCKNKSWSVVFLIIAILVGYSRMYLSEHFFEDVTAGSALGVFLTIFWLRCLDSRKFLNSPGWDRGLLKI